MRRILAIVSGGEAEANDRLAALKKQFGEAQFVIEPHDRKHQLVVNSDVTAPDFETMKRVANGYGSATTSEPKEVKQAPMPQNASSGPGPRIASGPVGGNPAAARPVNLG